MSDPVDWEEAVRLHHRLGLWHATRTLCMYSQVKDPTEVARDVVQITWETLWRKGRFSKALFITAVHGFAQNAVRSYRPIELRKGGGDERDRSTGRGKSQSRTTNVFPVQIFGGLIGEHITEDALDPGNNCGSD